MNLLPIPHQKRPETPENLKRALETLENSTNLIQRHSRIIQEQNEFLDAHQKSRTTITNNKPSRFESRIQNQQKLEIQHLKSLNDELRQNVESKINSQQQQIHKTLKARPAILNDRLRSDDRRIQALEQLNHLEKASTSSTLANQRNRTNILLVALRDAVKEEIQLRLSRRYLEVLEENGSTNPEDDKDSAQRLKDVQDDLDNLYAEIDDVTQLLVNHDHEQQLSTQWDKVLHLQHSNSIHVSQYVSKDLASLSEELEEIHIHKQMLQSHRVALERFNETQVKIGAMHESQTTRSSQLTEPNSFALESLGRQLNLFNETNLQAKCLAIEKGHKSLREQLEQTGSKEWLLNEILPDKSAHGLVHTNENLDNLDANIANMREKVDNAQRSDSNPQKNFKSVWVVDRP